MGSDFFLEEADGLREEAWEIMRQRSDVKFFLLTKRPQRVKDCLPEHWGKGWENIMLNVTCENQRRADERIPILLSLPFKHKGIMCAPFIGPVSIEKYLGAGQIEQVICGGENYDGARPCSFDWVKNLRSECMAYDITLCLQKHLPALLRQNVTAILCSHDLLAHTVMLHCLELGLRIPQDLSIIGFDDLPLCDYIAPPLTTIRQDRTQLGKSGFYALSSLLNSVPISTLLLHARLVLRQSCGQASPQNLPTCKM